MRFDSNPATTRTILATNRTYPPPDEIALEISTGSVGKLFTTRFVDVKVPLVMWGT